MPPFLCGDPWNTRKQTSHSIFRDRAQDLSEQMNTDRPSGHRDSLHRESHDLTTSGNPVKRSLRTSIGIPGSRALSPTPAMGSLKDPRQSATMREKKKKQFNGKVKTTKATNQ